MRSPLYKAYQRSLRITNQNLMCFPECVQSGCAVNRRLVPIKRTCMLLPTLLRRGMCDEESHKPLAISSQTPILQTPVES
jgi:hypothetical protein